MPSPEELAREKIDKLLTECGWIIQNRSAINLSAGSGSTINFSFLLSTFNFRSAIQRLYSMLRWFFFWWKMLTARRDQHEETGSARPP
jgi:hypothetical protein